MTRSEAIQDLEAIKEFFEQESGGAYPICIEYAIEELKKVDQPQIDCAWK